RTSPVVASCTGVLRRIGLMAPQIMSTPTANFGGNNGMIILADDLSGAQECIAAASRIPVGSIARTAPIATTILLGKEGTLPDAEILAIDTDSRCMPSEDATEQIHRALELLSTRKNFETGSPDQIFLKFDSILRGNIAAQLGKASEKIGPIVFCPAVPELNRVTRNGVVYVNQVQFRNCWAKYNWPNLLDRKSTRLNSSHVS